MPLFEAKSAEIDVIPAKISRQNQRLAEAGRPMIEEQVIAAAPSGLEPGSPFGQSSTCTPLEQRRMGTSGVQDEPV
jgi:hypothetical protein